ncbi:tRNA-specific adenosine deaminase subunit tad3 [Paramarasmius palmivorus]|uniref:tRNA-specific adenosine deaminase subunit tad3 n=1 Tax=Paramarasmius palmivorus TaxID=297713 RepID=A0AAW0DYK5_9AGAR
MSTQSSAAPEHLNSTGCRIQLSQGKGRGVYASRPIPKSTIIEISPVLFFSKEEYDEHGKYTVLDHYTFKWKDGRMALALGLDSIRYETARDIEQDEELFIFYGHKLWFEAVDLPMDSTSETGLDIDDGWGGLSAVHGDEDRRNPFLGGNQDEVVEEEDLPFQRIRPPPEEETLEAIRTVPAWVVDLPDPRHINTLLKWLKKVGLDDSELGHLKRIRKQDNKTSLLLTTSPGCPDLPEELGLSDPYQAHVPISPALTLPSLTLKATFWPTYYTPRRKSESDVWARGKCSWAWEAMRTLISEATQAAATGEASRLIIYTNYTGSKRLQLPIAAYVPTPYQSPGKAYIGHDTRNSTCHPLRHAVLNLVRQLADDHHSREAMTEPESINEPEDNTPRNGTNYLLTSRTVFLTHEPCIMCSMALLHSRAKEVFYRFPMEKTGGCGGLACLPTLPGVNHRFEICRWTFQHVDLERLALDGNTDA